MTIAPIQFAISEEFRFDPLTGRYKYRDSGRFAPREAVTNIVQRNIDRQQDELRSLAPRVANGEISLREFQTQAADLLKQLHVQSAFIGSNGIDRLSPETRQAIWLDVARELRRQYRTGIDPVTGDRFGLQELSRKLAAGELSEAQLSNSLRMFGESAKVSYWRAAARAEAGGDRPYAIRELSAVAEHCKECIALSELPPQPIEDVVPPTQQCACRTNCACSLVFMSLEEALANGMDTSGDLVAFAASAQEMLSEWDERYEESTGEKLDA